MRSGVTEVAIVGAGPYGLSIAAHLKQAGVPFRIFGKPMQTWAKMPKGMFLKSFGFATNIYTPGSSHGFVAYCKSRGLESFEPCSIADFARYGVWVQEDILPELEDVDVENVTRDENGFALTLADGGRVRANRIVIAVGTKYFSTIPRELADLPSAFVSHTSDHGDYHRFDGKDVCVVGAGQSAFETARLLTEAGANPHILVRESSISFSDRMIGKRTLWERVRAPESGLGPGLKSWLIESVPLLPHLLPDSVRLPFVKNHLGPSGAWWLRERIVGKVPVSTNTTIAKAEEADGRLVLSVVENGGAPYRKVCDHVIAGTGFVVDVDRLDFLDETLRRDIRRLVKGPALDRHFQSSVPGLYFVGLASSLSFGPLFRFVAGAAYTARRLSHELARTAKPAAPSVRMPVPAE